MIRVRVGGGGTKSSDPYKQVMKQPVAKALKDD